LISVVEGPLRSFGRKGQGPLVEWEEHYRLRDETISSAFGACLAPEVADLIDVAVAVFVTDRLTRRRPHRHRDDGLHWERKLKAEVAVRSVERWREPELNDGLHELLRWLTDDEWEISFFEGGPRLPRDAEVQGTLFEEPLRSPASAGLLSGGLDSLLGAAADLEGEGELLLVSTTTHHKLGALQRLLAGELSRIGPRTVRWLGVPVNLTARGKALGDSLEEESARSRAFVFLALGAAAALSGGCSELRVYENGPGALNLALAAGQRGAMNTRAMRPETLKRMSQLVEGAVGVPFSIVNPNMGKTKAEMCAEAGPELDWAIARSRSCDTALTGRRPSDAPCGRCTSCVLRRQALLAADRSNLDAFDVDLIGGDSLRAVGPGIIENALRLMLGQVHQISVCLRESDPWAALVRSWPDLVSARNSMGVESQEIVGLLRRYCDEWQRLDSPVVHRLLAA
jgi:7-cyano-7-deazaguanine synthase in queuosine biosynthesis